MTKVVGPTEVASLFLISSEERQIKHSFLVAHLQVEAVRATRSQMLSATVMVLAAVVLIGLHPAAHSNLKVISAEAQRSVGSPKATGRVGYFEHQFGDSVCCYV